jgi:trk system potassium uptake protein TrkH
LGLTTELNDAGMVLIMITMFLGRLGPITIGYALAYQAKQPGVRRPMGKIMIG